MITQSHYSDDTFFCPHCGQFQESLMGDVPETRIRCINCQEFFFIKDSIQNIDDELNLLFKLLGENHGRN